MIYDSTGLHTELRAAGILINGCDSNGRIDWIAPPTPQEQATAQAVLAAHDPGKREREDRTARQEADDIEAMWDTATAAQRLRAMRWAVRKMLGRQG